MKIVKEATGSVTLYPFLFPEASEELERGAFYISVFPGEIRLKRMEPLTVSLARDVAEAIYKAAEIAEGLRQNGAK